MTDPSSFQPTDVLDFWFPDSGHWTSVEAHADFWKTRMEGGMDEEICNSFQALTDSAARGHLDHWADTPRGRLALIIALDQFPRSLWRDTPAAFAQDIKAARLSLEALKNGHYTSYAPWEKQFLIISIVHCEGPDHLQRLELTRELSVALAKELPEVLAPMGEISIKQNDSVTEVIRRFGRHAHRNPVLGRPSSPDEEAYIATGAFPHNSKPLDAP